MATLSSFRNAPQGLSRGFNKKGSHSRFYTHNFGLYSWEYPGARTSLCIFAPVSGNFTGLQTHTEWMSLPCLGGGGVTWLVHYVNAQGPLHWITCLQRQGVGYSYLRTVNDKYLKSPNMRKRLTPALSWNNLNQNYVAIIYVAKDSWIRRVLFLKIRFLGGN